jgi:hypothetical protein
MTHPRAVAPARYSTLSYALAGACALEGSNLCAMSGEMIPARRPQNEAIPQAVPLIGASKASGVNPYRTLLNIDWKKY